MVEKYKIGEENVNYRIDKLVPILNENITRMLAQKLLDEGKILVNDKKEKPSYKVKVNDIISIEIPEAQETEIIPEDIPLDVLYEDDYIIVVNKAKGMVVHPANGNYTGTLVNALLYRCKDSLSGIGGEKRPGIVHRLDKDTSGVLIVAKCDKAHINLSEQIKEHKVKKKYIALVKGIVKDNEATIDMPIGRSKKDRKKMDIDKNGKNAITHFKVLKRYQGYTLLKVNIETGRTHQIRVHLSTIGYPIVGDMVYSTGKNEFNVEGQMLHAWRIEFTHPITGEKMNIEAPLPQYFEDVLKKLEDRVIDI